MGDQNNDFQERRVRDLSPPKKGEVTIVNGAWGKRVPLRRDVAEAYENMLDAAKREVGVRGNIMKVYSGYRSIQKQKKLWDQALEKHGSPEKARKWVAPPGRSVHQTGRAMDIHLGVRSGSKYVKQQKETVAYNWLKNNANKYGFYPYKREPWHWEYNPPKTLNPPTKPNLQATRAPVRSIYRPTTTVRRRVEPRKFGSANSPATQRHEKPTYLRDAKKQAEKNKQKEQRKKEEQRYKLQGKRSKHAPAGSLRWMAQGLDQPPKGGHLKRTSISKHSSARGRSGGRRR